MDVEVVDGVADVDVDVISDEVLVEVVAEVVVADVVAEVVAADAADDVVAKMLDDVVDPDVTDDDLTSVMLVVGVNASTLDVVTAVSGIGTIDGIGMIEVTVTTCEVVNASAMELAIGAGMGAGIGCWSRITVGVDASSGLSTTTICA